MVPSATIGVHRGGQHFRYDPAGQPRAMHPSEKPGMRVAGTVWQDQVFKLTVNIVKGLPRLRERPAESGTAPFGHGLPYRTLPRRPEELDSVLERGVRASAKALPIIGIEGEFRLAVLFTRRVRRHRTGIIAHGFRLYSLRIGDPNAVGQYCGVLARLSITGSPRRPCQMIGG